jgi:hypothetical protein
MGAWENIVLRIAASAASTVSRDGNYVECALLLVLWMAARSGRLPRLDGSARLKSLAARISRAPALSYAVVIALSAALRPLLFAGRLIPHPFVFDEFSYRFLADTLLAGRLANPTHPLWIHFETIHIFHQPTYSSMHMPLPALFLAAGKFVTGEYWWGVWLSGVLFAAALLWMLRGWFSPRWALFGTTLAILRFGVASYWIGTYWGGFPAAIGGALITGAYPRLLRHPSWTAGLALGGGVGMLAACRPYEGGLLTAVFAGGLAWSIFRRGRPSMAALALRGALPALLVFAIALAGLLTYCFHVTGSPFVLPYQVNQKLYGWPMTLAWFQPPAVPLRHIGLQNYYDFEVEEHRGITTVDGALEQTGSKLELLWRFYFGPALSIPLLFLPAMARSPRRWLLLAFGLVLLGVLSEQSSYPHYLGPVTAAVVGIWIACLRRMRAWERCRRHAPISLYVLDVMVVMLLIHIAVKLPSPPTYQSWCCSDDPAQQRAGIEERLRSMPGFQLVFVRHAAHPKTVFEWVYNDPDIDRARIVWAQDMGPSANRELLNYFPNRRAWLVQPDADPTRLTPYTAPFAGTSFAIQH